MMRTDDVYTCTLATRAQLGGMFFGTSMASKMLLSRVPCLLTHSAIALMPSRNGFFSRVPKAR